jgi:hypothetical protein
MLDMILSAFLAERSSDGTAGAALRIERRVEVGIRRNH